MASVHRTRRSNQLDDGAPRTPPPAFGISMRGNRFVEPSGRCSGVLPGLVLPRRKLLPCFPSPLG